MDYETRRDTIVTNAWEIWTKNGLGLETVEIRKGSGETVMHPMKGIPEGKPVIVIKKD